MNLLIHCPEMAVRNTGYFWQLTAERLTDELECRGAIEGLGPLTITFPPCRVKYISPGKWMVDAVIARGSLDSGQYIQIGFPEEPVVRRLDKLVALRVPSIREQSYLVTDNGRRYIECELPEAEATPVGLGMRAYIVEAVTIEGEVEI